MKTPFLKMTIAGVCVCGGGGVSMIGTECINIK